MNVFSCSCAARPPPLRCRRHLEPTSPPFALCLAPRTSHPPSTSARVCFALAPRAMRRRSAVLSVLRSCSSLLRLRPSRPR
eukprot:scaffold18987_cov109-Isochrysis_galbana.AAC.3